MNDHDLERLEQDLDAVSGRLQGRVEWQGLEPRVRRALGRPRRELLGSLVLIVAFACLGFWTPVGWMLAGGLLLAELPGRMREARGRRRTLAEVGRGDLLVLIRRELMTELGDHFTKALGALAFALLFAAFGILAAADPRPGLVAAAALVALALVRFLWLLPRASRALRSFDRGELAP